jgi:hypothetical protein
LMLLGISICGSHLDAMCEMEKIDKMRKIAIITVVDRYSNYDDYSEVIKTVTEWTEVSDADYVSLVAFQRRNGNFVILEFPNQKQFIANTVAEYVKLAKKEEAERQAEKAAADAKKATALRKRLEKQAKNKEDLFEQLKKELGKA